MHDRQTAPDMSTIDLRINPSVVPAIDALLERFCARGLVAATEVVDALLDLRSLAVASDIVAGRS